MPNKRKIHIKKTAYTGGTAISVILLFAIMCLIIFRDFKPYLINSVFNINSRTNR